jgi:hypothetical protein
MSFLPFLQSSLHLYMALISWRDWPGYVKGLEFSVVDLLALIIYCSLPRKSPGFLFLIPMALYFITSVSSVAVATFPEAALFYPWQLARMFFLFLVVFRGVCTDEEALPSLLKGIAAGVILEGGVCLWQKLIIGVVQTPGTYIHQNLLGIVMHFSVLPFFAILLKGNRGWLPGLVVLVGLLVDVLTTSRGTVGLVAVGVVAIFALSAFRVWTRRKSAIMVLGLFAMGLYLPVAIWTFEQRFVSGDETLSEDEMRVRYKEVAQVMLSDHPMGVGANHFTFIGNVSGYFGAIGGVLTTYGRDGNVHNAYWLVATETGYLGLLSFGILLTVPAVASLVGGLRRANRLEGDLLIGLRIAIYLVTKLSVEERIL